LHMDGTDGSQNFVDSSLQAHSVTAKGSARISTAQSKFGGASGLFGGAGDYLSLADSSDWAFGSGDFTIDFWVRFNALPAASSNEYMLIQRADGANQWYFLLYNNAGTYQWIFQALTGGVSKMLITKNSPGLLVSTWYHVAVVRSGNSWYIFQGGTQCGTTDTDADGVDDYAATLTIGVHPTAGRGLNGWLDELRISKGIARWTSNFTPPTAPY